ncbi:MAG: phosphopantetheine-binding protein, partial [Paracoccaceae bacterium]|nr:phosphopantetheine-binding protein [Paracoccaceae bacterium]
RIGVQDNFFALGGHSLLAVQAHREIRNDLGVAKLSITDIFRAPTLEAFAAIVAKKSGSGAKAAPAPAPTPAPAPSSPAKAETALVAPEPQPSGNARVDAMARRREMRARRQNR